MCSSDLSGCDKVLAGMKRGYTAGYYMEMLDRIRRTVPGATISSDFIVGFPGETSESFDKTVEMVRAARFKNSFIFKYSPREGTRAFPLPDDVPEEEKKRRNNELLEVQAEISLADSQAQIGKLVDVLVEGPSKTALKEQDDSPVGQMTGRTQEDRIVVFEGNIRQAGHFLPVRILDASPYTLFGEVVTQELVQLGI